LKLRSNVSFPRPKITQAAIEGDTEGDRIDGGKGNDTIWLGGGRDIVVLARGNGSDTINNFQPCQTQIGLSGGLRCSDLTITQGDGATLIRVVACLD
jgi:Ca2+-binding RTX toxin-like protein